MERDKARSEYLFEEKRIIANAQGIRELIRQLETELEAVEKRINSIDVGQSILVDPTYLSQLREQIAQQMSLVAEKMQAEQQLLSGERKTLSIRDEKQRACQGLREAIEFKLFMSGLNVEQCPHCEQPITQVRVEEEIQTKRCRVCHNELQPVSSVEQYRVLLKEEEKKISELEDDIQKIKKEIKKAVKEREATDNWSITKPSFKTCRDKNAQDLPLRCESLLTTKAILEGKYNNYVRCLKKAIHRNSKT